MMELVQNTLSRFVADGQIAGCSARIMRSDEVCFEGSFGYADIEKKIPMSDSTIFPIASMSKVVTVAGIMRLYEQGLFKMWDPVSEYLPGFRNPTVALEKPDGSYEKPDRRGKQAVCAQEVFCEEAEQAAKEQEDLTDPVKTRVFVPLGGTEHMEI